MIPGIVARKPAGSSYPGVWNILMHMDGANNSTVFTEEGGKTVTRVGSGVLTKTADKKFGTASAQGFSGSSRLTVPHSSIAGDFTVGCSAKLLANASGSETFFSFAANDMQVCVRNAANDIFLWQGGATRLTVGAAITINTWPLIVLDRYSGVIYLSVNGQVIGSYPYATTIPAGALTIGAFYDGTEASQSTTYIDEVFLRTGGSLFAGGNFVPPTNPFAA